MPNITVSLPADIKQRMGKFKEINWSAVARGAIEEKLQLLAAMDELLGNSKLTEQDINKEAQAIKKKVWRKYSSKTKK